MKRKLLMLIIIIATMLFSEENFGQDSDGFGNLKISLSISDSPVITSEPDDQKSDIGGSVNFDVVATGTDLVYQWKKGPVILTDGGNISGANTATLTINPVNISDVAANYYVEITGKFAPDEYSVNVALLADANSNIIQELSINTQVYENSEVLKTIYSFKNSDCKIPEGFSPNADGVNDFFIIREIENYSKNSLVIFNSRGNKVFEASPYLNTWNGRLAIGINSSGDELPIGTYFYVLVLDNGTEVLKGSVYLKR